MVAALGLQRHPVAGLGGQHFRPRPGGDHRAVTGDRPIAGLHRAQLPVLDLQRLGAGLDEGAATGLDQAHQGGDIGAGIDAVAAFVDMHGELVAPVQRRLALVQLVGIQLGPGDALFAADFP